MPSTAAFFQHPSSRSADTRSVEVVCEAERVEAWDVISLSSSFSSDTAVGESAEVVGAEREGLDGEGVGVESSSDVGGVGVWTVGRGMRAWRSSSTSRVYIQFRRIPNVDGEGSGRSSNGSNAMSSLLFSGRTAAGKDAIEKRVHERARTMEWMEMRVRLIFCGGGGGTSGKVIVGSVGTSASDEGAGWWTARKCVGGVDEESVKVTGRAWGNCLAEWRS